MLRGMTNDRPIVKAFFEIAEAYATGHRITEATASMRLFNQGVRLAQFRSGERQIIVDTLEAALKKMSDDWPPHIAWPYHLVVLRPSRVATPEKRRVSA